MRSEIYRALRANLEAERPAAVVTVLAGAALGRQCLIADDHAVIGSLGAEALDRVAFALAVAATARFASERRTIEHDGAEVDLFIDVYPPRRTLVVIGAVHAAIPLISFANTLGFRTVVIDPRTAFATPERFAHADVLDTDWPDVALARIGLHAGSFVAALSHDLKLDLPALAAALRSPARYIGALGSKKTHQKRLTALRSEGFSDADLARIHNPIGLALGGRRAEEIAVSVAAELVAVDHGVRMTRQAS